MEIFVNMSGAEKQVALLGAIADMGKDQEYQDALYDHAYAEADADFNRQAAALGATGSISHMFEWGTLGINRGRSNMRPNPLSERARLWKTVNMGRGLNRTVGFTFKPSLALVPKPTVKMTGADSETLSRLKDHTFWNKAAIMESGQEVTVARKGETKALFIPLMRNRTYGWATEREKEQGFAFRPGPMTIVPGKNVRGNFTKFFVTYWNTRGPQIIDKDISASIEYDMETEARAAETGGTGTKKSIRGYNSSRAIKAYEAKMKKNIQMRARARRIGN